MALSLSLFLSTQHGITLLCNNYKSSVINNTYCYYFTLLDSAAILLRAIEALLKKR